MKYLFFILALMLSSCHSVNEKDIEGTWILERLSWNNTEISVNSHNQKVMINPIGYEGKDIVVFTLKDSTCCLPGINSFDVCLKWRIYKSSIILSYDSTLFYKNIFERIDQHKPVKLFYKLTPGESSLYLSDSLSFQNLSDSLIHSPEAIAMIRSAKVYIGKYSLTGNGSPDLFLESKTTYLHLENLDFLLMKGVDDLFKQIRK